ncbi:MAG: response regulator [Sulfitobacter sp.]|nr:response regulator [Sulfitobacter sp.]
MTPSTPVSPLYPKAPVCLIVEDNEIDSMRLTRIIRKSKLKLRIEVASTITRARETVAWGNIALILLDNNLPDGLGADFAIELAQDPDTANIPVIMVSDWPSPFMWEKAASAGVRYVLGKTEFDTRYVHASLQPRRTNAR